MKEYVALTLSESSDIEKVGVITPGTGILLSSNAELAARLGFSYRFLSFSIRHVPKFPGGNDDDLEKGKTSSTGLSLGFNFRHWVQELSWNRTRGFYLENTRNFRPGWDGGTALYTIPRSGIRSVRWHHGL